MTQRMSVSMTLESVQARIKVVTRRHRDSWRTLRPGMRITLIEKGMGLPKGAKQVVVCDVEIVDVSVEPLSAVTHNDVINEGLADRAQAAVDAGEAPDTVTWFIRFWLKGHGYRVDADPDEVECRRIEWRYL